MKKSEYLEKLNNIRSIAKKREYDLKGEFAFSRVSVKEGDIIHDSIKKIKVVKIQFTTKDEFPECVFTGVLITKKGEPYKSGETGVIFQHSVLAT